MSKKNRKKMNKKTAIALGSAVVVLNSVTYVSAFQNDLWAKNFGSDLDDSFASVISTSDGGYLTAGYSEGITSFWSSVNGKTGSLVKYDSDGNVKWAKSIHDTFHNSLSDVVETKDGGFVAVGYASGPNRDPDWKVGSGPGSGNDDDALLVKYNSDGVFQWKSVVGGDDIDRYLSVTELNDGSIVAVGHSHAEISGGVFTGYEDQDNAIVVKYNSGGALLTAVSFGGTNKADSNVFNSVEKASNANGFIAIGNSNCAEKNSNWGNNGGNDAIIVKFDNDVSVEWAKNIGGTSNDMYYDVTEAGETFIAVGSSYDGSITLHENWGNNGGEDAIIVHHSKTDGSVIAAENIGSSSNDAFNSIQSINDGGFIVAGTSSGESIGLSDNWENSGGEDAVVAKFDSNNDLQWAINNGGLSDDRYLGILGAASNSFVAVGESFGASIGLKNNWSNNGDLDSIIVKFNDVENLTASVNYTPASPTTGSVTATLTTNNEIVTPDGWEKVNGTTFTREFHENVSEAMIITDVNGFTYNVQISISNIFIAPTGSISYSSTAPTKGPVTATLITNNDIITPDGWQKVDSKTFTKVYYENVDETLTFTDINGFTGSVDIFINNIIASDDNIFDIDKDSGGTDSDRVISNDAKSTSPDTSDSSNILVFWGILMLGLGSLTATIKKFCTQKAK